MNKENNENIIKISTQIKENQINIYTDSYEDIFAAFSSLKTSDENTRYAKLDDGSRLYDIIKKYTSN